MFWLLRLTILASLVTAGCAMIPAAMTDWADKTIKDNGEGSYTATVTIAKDGKKLGAAIGQMDCTANAVKLTGCHPKAITFEGPK